MLIAVFIQRKPMKQGGKQASVCITASVKSEKSKCGGPWSYLPLMRCEQRETKKKKKTN